MAHEVSGLYALHCHLDKAAAALEETDQPLAPVQGAGSVADEHAMQDGCIRGLAVEIEAAQDAGDDVIASVYIGGSRDADTEVTLTGAGTGAGEKFKAAIFDKEHTPISKDDSIVVKAKSTDAVNCKPAGIKAIVLVQLGRSEL